MWRFQHEIGTWGFLPSELLDSVKATLEQSESSDEGVVQTMGWSRSVNKHWSMWATRAITTLWTCRRDFRWEMAAQKFVNINRVIIREQYPGDLFEKLCQFSSLTTLHFDKRDLRSKQREMIGTDKELEYLGRITTLRYLSLPMFTYMTSDQMKHFTSLTSLTRLCLQECSRITDEGANSLASLTALKDLILNCCWEITDAGLQHLMSLTSLTVFGLSGCRKITDEGANSFASMTALKMLDLGYCKQITDAVCCT